MPASMVTDSVRPDYWVPDVDIIGQSDVCSDVCSEYLLPLSSSWCFLPFQTSKGLVNASDHLY